MNILSVFVLFATILKCVVASEDTLGVAFKGAVDGENFEWLKESWRIWKERKDLFDYVIAKGAVATVRLIQNVGDAKEHVLAALFDQGEERLIDEVLGRVNYNDYDLHYLTGYRPELAGSPEKFFRILDKIKGSWSQEEAVRWGVKNLFNSGKHDLVVPLVNALGKRTFKSKSLKNAAIQEAFIKELKEAIKTLLDYITNILRSPLKNMPLDCMNLGTMADQTKSSGFY